MSLEALMTQPLSILSAAQVTDAYGNDVADWSAVTTVTVRGWVAQRTAAELLGDRGGETSEWVAFLPASVDVTAADRLVRWGVTFEVAGPVNPAHRPHSGLHHIEVPLRIVEG